jgi:hypothetical protein
MKSITLCGSGKYKELIHKISEMLIAKNYVVIPPPLHNIDYLTKDQDAEGKLLSWKGATFAHLNRIDKTQICIMINPKGYLGVGSTMELGYASAKNKLIISLQHDTELARESLFNIVLETEVINEIIEKLDNILNNL